MLFKNTLKFQYLLSIRCLPWKCSNFRFSQFYNFVRRCRKFTVNFKTSNEQHILNSQFSYMILSLGSFNRNSYEENFQITPFCGFSHLRAVLQKNILFFLLFGSANKMVFHQVKDINFRLASTHSQCDDEFRKQNVCCVHTNFKWDIMATSNALLLIDFLVYFPSTPLIAAPSRRITICVREKCFRNLFSWNLSKPHKIHNN